MGHEGLLRRCGPGKAGLRIVCLKIESISSSRTCERSARDPGPITTDVCVAQDWSHNPIDNSDRWLWVPAPVRNCALGGDDIETLRVQSRRARLIPGLRPVPGPCKCDTERQNRKRGRVLHNLASGMCSIKTHAHPL